jgi:hypothetical protein
MVSRNYLLKQPAAPSPGKVFIDQAVIPALIDAAAAVEQQLERVATGVRNAPILGMGVACGVGWLASRAARPATRRK